MSSQRVVQQIIVWVFFNSRGFVDAEGCFYLAKRTGASTLFEVYNRIALDDKEALDFIKSALGVGIVRISKSRATFIVST